MGKAGGGRNEVDPRFISKFTVINLQFPMDTTLKHIYGSILSGHLQTFPKSFKPVTEVVVQMTLDLFKVAIVELPPTPSKFHYIFNLKDLSRTYAGIVLSSPVIFKDPRQLVRVWRNEFTRVFCDRLISDVDINLMNARMIEVVDKNYSVSDVRPARKSMSIRGARNDKKNSFSEMAPNEYIMRNPLLFGDYRHGIVDEEIRLYEDLLDFTAVMHLFREIMDEYNERVGNLDLVLFDDCLDHLTRVHRTLRMHK